MKILMVSSNTAESPYPIYPLGASIIAGVLAKEGHEVRQFDFLQNNNSLDALGEEIERFQPGLTGISIRNIDNVNIINEQYYIDTVRDIVNKIRESSDGKIILGGAGFSLIPDLILQKTGADYGIIGEGESLIVGFADNAAKGIYPEEHIIGSDGKLEGRKLLPAKYDDRLMEFYLRSGNIASIQTKRGCTSKCVYCTYPVLEGATIRRRDPGSVVDDIELLSEKHKAKYIFFVDSVFNDDEDAYLDLIEEMERRKVNIPWTGFFKPAGLNDEIVERMKQTGLIAVELGSDASCNSTLRKMGKGFTFKDIEECNDLFSGHGIAASHFFMFGGPGETKETVYEGIRNISGLKKCIVFIFMGIRILPNTSLARIAINEKVIRAGEDMLKPVYYISPDIDKTWLEETLKDAFSKTRNCIFPPDAYDGTIKALHKMGYSGTLWNLLISGKKRPARKRHAAG
jgi:lipid biosynthesis B12-binding/radical SAM protein